MLRIARALVFITVAASALPAAANQWSGRYTSSFNFRMGSESVCPRVLPITIELSVEDGQATGAIFNNGGGNTHEFCKLYHNGTISGSVSEDGSVSLRVRQTDAHSLAYSSNRISGNIAGQLRLMSVSSKYHPTHSFQLTRQSNTNSSFSRNTANAGSVTPASTAMTDFVAGAFNALSLEKRKLIQKILMDQGYYSSSIDGLYGRGTRSAISRFASDNGYTTDNARGVNTTLSAIFEVQEPATNTEVVIATTVEIAPTVVTSPQVTPSTSGTISENLLGLEASLQANEVRWQNAASSEEAQQYADEIQASIVMYLAIKEVVARQPVSMRERVLGVVDGQIARLTEQKERLQQTLTARFATPIRPSNANLSVSAFRASDTFPKVPFYVPGTNEIGEMLLVPRISDEGYLNYQFDFLDPTTTYDKVRDSLLISHEDIDVLIEGLAKIDEWTVVSQENGVTRRLAKTAACLPEGACEVKETGTSSTEIIFQIYEDGSTSGRIQLNKGRFNMGYNMSVESSILLHAYLIYMRDAGEKEFDIGVMTDDEVLDMFK